MVFRKTFVFASCLVMASSSVAQSVGPTEQVPCSFVDASGDGTIRWGNPKKYPITAPWEQGVYNNFVGYTKFWYDEGKNQWGGFYGSINDEGLVRITWHVRNEAVLDGDNFAVNIAIASKSGEIITSGSARRGANSKGFCKTTGKGHSCWRITKEVFTKEGYYPQVPTDRMEDVGYIVVTPGMYDKVDDGKFWGNVKSIVDCYGMLNGVPSGG